MRGRLETRFWVDGLTDQEWKIITGAGRSGRDDFDAAHEAAAVGTVREQGASGGSLWRFGLRFRIDAVQRLRYEAQRVADARKLFAADGHLRLRIPPDLKRCVG